MYKRGAQLHSTPRCQMHVSGFCVRHLGALRALVQSADGETTRARAESGTLYAQRLSTSLLSEMVARVAKQLVRHGLRSLGGGGSPGLAEAATSGGDSRELVRVLCRCLNDVLAPEGAWGAQVDASGGRQSSSALWRFSIRTHLQLKFGSHLPALTSAELDDSLDLRAAVSRLALAQSLCEQLGVTLHPDALLRFARGGSIHAGDARAVAAAAVPAPPGPPRHAHDPVLLPRLKWRSRLVELPSLDNLGARLHSPAADAPGGDVSLVHLSDALPPAELLQRAAEEFRRTVSEGGRWEEAPTMSDALWFSRVFGTNYSYTELGAVSCNGAGRFGIEEGVSTWAALVAQASASIPRAVAPDASAIVSRAPGAPSTHAAMLSPSDILGVDVVCKGLQEDAAVFQQLLVLPEVAGPGASVARAHAVLTAARPCFDVALCSPNVRVSNALSGCLVSRSTGGDVGSWLVHVPDTATLCSDAGIAIAAPNFCWRPWDGPPASAPEPRPAPSAAVVPASVAAVAPESAAVVAPVPTPDSSTVAGALASSMSAELVAAIDASPSVLAVAFVFHGGYDLSTVSVGLAHTPLRLDFSDGWWLDLAKLETTSGRGRAENRLGAWQARGLSQAQAEAKIKSQPLFRHSGAFGVGTGRPHNVLAFVLDAALDPSQASIWLNGVDCGSRFVGINMKRALSVGRGADASEACLRPVVRLQGGGSCISQVTVVDLKGCARGILAPCDLGAVSSLPEARSAVPRWLASSSAWSIDDLLGSAFDGVVAAPDALIRFFAADGDVNRGRRLCSLASAAFGAGSRRHVECQVGFAESLVRAGLSRAAVTLLRDTFSGARAVAPQHVVARAYVCIGDAWLLGERSAAPRRSLHLRWRTAEMWYARALSALCSHAPRGAESVLGAALQHAAAGSAEAAPEVRRANNVHVPRLEERLEALNKGGGGDGGIAAHLQPYALLVLDRLLGVIRAQSRVHHALPLLQLFCRVWATFPCPSHDSIFLSAQGEGWSARGFPVGSRGGGVGYGATCAPWWSRSPYVRVFGHAVPHASAMLASLRPEIGRLQVPDTLAVHSEFAGLAHQRGAQPTATWEAIEAWVAAVGSMADQGPARDIRVPPALGLTAADEAGVVGAGEGAEVQRDVASSAAEASPGQLFVWGGGRDRCGEARVGLPLVALPGAPAECIVDVCIAKTGSNNGAVLVATSRGRTLTWSDSNSGSGGATMAALGISDSTDRVVPWAIHPLRTLQVRARVGREGDSIGRGSGRAHKLLLLPPSSGEARCCGGVRRGLLASVRPRWHRLLMGPGRLGRCPWARRRGASCDAARDSSTGRGTHRSDRRRRTACCRRHRRPRRGQGNLLNFVYISQHVALGLSLHASNAPCRPRCFRGVGMRRAAAAWDTTSPSSSLPLCEGCSSRQRSSWQQALDAALSWRVSLLRVTAQPQSRRTDCCTDGATSAGSASMTATPCCCLCLCCLRPTPTVPPFAMTMRPGRTARQPRRRSLSLPLRGVPPSSSRQARSPTGGLRISRGSRVILLCAFRVCPLRGAASLPHLSTAGSGLRAGRIWESAATTGPAPRLR